jgi:hypothetical protein
MMKIFNIIGVILVCSGILSPDNFVYSQPNLPGQDLANDIEIMEIVLDKLISPERGNLPFFSSNTRGYYLANYGVIFDVSYSFLNRGFISFGINQRFQIKENNLIVIDEEKEEKQLTDEIEKDIEKLKKSIVKFLSSWTTALSDLHPDEKVAVIVDFNGFVPSITSAVDFSTHKLIASVPIREIANMRKGSITLSEFEKKVDFDEKKSQDEDISIFSRVIQTSLEHSDQKMDFDLAGNVKGIYFNGYGVIFFTDVSFGSNLFTIYSDAFRKGKERSFSITAPAPDETAKSAKNLEKVEQKLIQVMSNYGHNLKTLQPDEWVEIAINYKSIPIKENYSKSILRVQKKFIDDYNRDRLKFDQFKKMVKVTYY